MALVRLVGSVIDDYPHDPTLKPLSKLPRARLNLMRDGERARVHGVARAHGAPLTAPLTGRACVYWRVALERAADQSLDRWSVAAAAPMFFVDADGASALVHAPGATFFTLLNRYCEVREAGD